MIRIELVEDGPAGVRPVRYVDAIEEAMLREHEAFEWALARGGDVAVLGVPEPARGAAAARRRTETEALRRAGRRRRRGPGLLALVVGSARRRGRGARNARCPICMDRAVSAHKGAAFEPTFAAELCCVCGATTCAPAPRA